MTVTRIIELQVKLENKQRKEREVLDTKFKDVVTEKYLNNGGSLSKTSQETGINIVRLRQYLTSWGVL